MPRYRYTADSGETHSIRLSSDSATAGSFTGSATVTSSIKAKVSKGSREFGLRPRGVRLSRNLGDDDEPNMRYRFLPVATEALYDGAGFAEDSEITIGGDTWTVTSKVPEDY